MRAHASRSEQTAKVLDIARQDDIAVADEQRDMGVDDVGRLRGPAKVARDPGHPIVEPDFGDASQEAGEERPAGAAAAPRLRHAPRRCRHPIAPATSGLYEGSDLPVAAVEGDERAGVEYERHSRCARALLALVREKAVRPRDLLLGECAELLLPVRDGFAQGLEPQAVTCRFREPGRDALVRIAG